MKINSVSALEILDSRGNPTVEVEIKTAKGIARAAAPSGASTGSFEAIELRDGGKRYLGKGVQNAVENVNKTIGPEFVKGSKAPKKTQKAANLLATPADFDKLLLKLDGTKNKMNLGANAICATSMAVMRAFAMEEEKPLCDYVASVFGKESPKLPQPMFNILNGGKHAGTKLAIQEFMIIPKGKDFSETLQMASEIYHVLGKLLVEKYGPSAKNVGDEGGYGAPMDKTEDALNAIMKAIEEAGYSDKTKIGIDAAASSFYDGITKTYHIDERGISGDMLKKYYEDFIKRYPIETLEDPFNEDDFALFAALNDAVGKDTTVVGDDLLVTNPERIKEAIEHCSCGALLLKVNQIGTVSEAIEAAKMSREAGWKIVTSHRSAETEDTFIADFSCGINSEYIKTGAPARGERTAKYNQLLRIEKMLE
jgi:enolase